MSLVCIPILFTSDKLPYSFEFLKCSLLIGVLGSLGNGFLIKALESGDLSVLGPINSYKAVVGLLFGMLLLKEMPNLYGIWGMLLIIIGSYFVLDTEKEKINWSVFKRKDIQYRFLALIFCAAEAIYLKKLILLSDIKITFIIWCTFGLIFSCLLIFIKRISLSKEVTAFSSESVWNFFAIPICTGIMQYTTNFVFANMNVAYALSLFQLSSILSIILGYKIFKETNIIKKLVGAFIMVVGAVMIIVFK